ncbi:MULTISPECIES: hypothetical protein [unclassified Rhodococcus (in: high G+C Gram-positive bacteria)]|uniref:hypothetical protein n=1 Tax=unclassified Rhodococcus (in: high G+C Gram-positive bacteria) TaxID=192944 RepID=UPI000B9C02C0|nr:MULTISPECIES: hypothetical protein [unclassified Rhodococcus (in: high G+C Gram-positive bacteria)]OZE35576.1 hypothetical protein CH259_16235 [Rhodococcus sp. 05-2254-4]OZE48005.1 hypothetical protein CH261_08830 [Rhodococcus sp. 05-2254-3]OZE49216.1 hypothetical protein CH283_16615 [Rhodococcus sp. 05-2254-2]
MTQTFLSMREISDRYDVPLGTLKAWVRRGGKFPEADARVGSGEGQASALGWTVETVDEWERGYRPEGSRTADARNH